MISLCVNLQWRRYILSLWKWRHIQMPCLAIVLCKCKVRGEDGRGKCLYAATLLEHWDCSSLKCSWPVKSTCFTALVSSIDSYTFTSAGEERGKAWISCTYLITLVTNHQQEHASQYPIREIQAKSGVRETSGSHPNKLISNATYFWGLNTTLPMQEMSSTE